MHFNILKKFKSPILGLLPSKYIFLISMLFFFGGLIFALIDPRAASSTFNGGIFTGTLVVLFDAPTVITPKYLINQFIYFLGANAFHIFLNNLYYSLICIFTGVMILPIIFLGLFTSFGAITGILFFKYGLYKTLLIILGSFHLYFEFLAALFAIEGFIKFYSSIYSSIKVKSFETLKIKIITEFLPILIKIILLLVIAAIFEIFWSTWWIYILTNHYISWQDFYFGVYSSTYTF
jgi:hypothetical protein